MVFVVHDAVDLRRASAAEGDTTSPAGARRAELQPRRDAPAAFEIPIRSTQTNGSSSTGQLQKIYCSSAQRTTGARPRSEHGVGQHHARSAGLRTTVAPLST